MKNKKTIKSINDLKIRMLLISMVLVMFSVVVFAVVEFYAFNVFSEKYYDPFNAVGMVLPMAVFLTIINYNVLKYASRYINELIYGIKKIVNGDFNVLLDTNKKGLLTEVFQNFNKMALELQGIKTLREDFVNQFSHEFKTPIMSINGFAKLMMEEELSREEQLKYLEIIVSESQRLSDLSRNTLLMSQLESQNWIAQKEKFSLDELLKECIILLESNWENKKIHISGEMKSGNFNGNREIMKQLWINLLNNAIKYTPRYGSIEITAANVNHSSIVTISDSGQGIDPVDLPSIFNKYYRGKGEESIKGLGLGLSISKRIVDLCNGSIEVHSLLNEGSQFIITLPN